MYPEASDQLFQVGNFGGAIFPEVSPGLLNGVGGGHEFDILDFPESA